MSPLLGEKIKLRDWVLEDLPFYEEWQRPGHAWQDMDGPYYPCTIEGSKKLTDDLRAKIEKNDFPSPRTRLVIADISTDQILGNVTSYWESKETNWLCVGITIYESSFWGKGIGKESLRLWTGYLFERRPELVRLDMRTWSGNLGLIHLAKSLGYRQEACFRKARIVKGEYYDGLGFGILREEWDLSSSTAESSKSTE